MGASDSYNTVKLENEYLRGAIWVPGEDGITTEGELPLVEDDPIVLEINEEIAEMYDSYLEFDSHDQGCQFNEEQRKADREKMLARAFYVSWWQVQGRVVSLWQLRVTDMGREYSS